MGVLHVPGVLHDLKKEGNWVLKSEDFGKELEDKKYWGLLHMSRGACNSNLMKLPVKIVDGFILDLYLVHSVLEENSNLQEGGIFQKGV